MAYSLFSPADFSPFFYETGDGVGPEVPPTTPRRRGTPINAYKQFKTIRDFRER